MLGIIEKIKMNDIDVKNINTIQQLKALDIYKFEDLKIIKYVYREYVAKLLMLNNLDFNDLLLLTHKLLSEHQDVRNK
jgi:superfamily I DNA/RNA helicase